MQQNQRHLNFNKFIEQRSVQISKFLSELQMDTKKKGHQSLPRSIRRRAMSHNRYRIPRKLRKNFEEDLAKAETMQKIPKCRKHIRKRRHLITAYKLRSGKVQWMSTHLWAARRMRMVEYYGYKIAITANNKCFRSAYRHFRHNACLIDLSYYNCLSIAFANSDLPKHFQLKEQEPLPSFNKIYEIKVYSSAKQERLICPAYLIRVKQEENALSLKIFFHPAAREQISKLSFQGTFKAYLQQGQCDLYLLVGPQATNILGQALQKYGFPKEQQTITSSFYDGSNSLLYMAKEDNFEIVNKPQVDCPVPLDRQLKKQYSPQENTSLRANMLKIFQNMQEKKPNEPVIPKAHDLFWQYYKQGQNKDLEKTVFKITLRSRYTHKRKNKVSKVEKKKIIQAEKQSPRERKPKQKSQNAMQDESQLSSSLNFSKQVFLETPVRKTAVLEEVHPLAVGQIGQGMLKGLLVLCSNANSCRLWRVLSHCHLKVIGRRQYAHMHLESNNLLFPENYAQTLSFAKYLNQKRQGLFRKYSRIPLHKQPHYFPLNSPYPFGLTAKQPMIVSVEMVGRGRCFEMSYICELLKEDMAEINKTLDNGKIGIVASQAKPQESKRKPYKTLSQIQSDLSLSSPQRKIIGQITTGAYLFSHSSEGGIGFIDKTLTTQDYLSVFGGYVFVRKTSSRHYMLAKLTTNFD